MGTVDKNLLNNEILGQLSEQEKELALSILEEYSKTGESQILQDLISEDYAELPVDIITFILDDRYLGRAWHTSDGKSKLYPYWEKRLKELFPDPYTTSVNNLIVSGARGLGKAQPLDSLVLAEQGFIAMGTIKLGDKVYGEDGLLHEVIGIYPQGKKDIYELVFSDGSRVRSTDDHLWTVIEKNNHNKVNTYRLKELRERGLFFNVEGEDFVEAKFEVPMTAPIKFKEQEVFMDPYALGCLIGKGSTRDETKENKKPYPHALIPKEYLHNDVNTRLSLLQGILDAGGTVDEYGHIVFSTSGEQLKDDVVCLVQSLGGNAPWRLNLDNAHTTVGCENKEEKVSYNITVVLPKDLLPFRAQQKLEKIKSTINVPFRAIKEIKHVGKEEAQCIRVNNPSHLYLTNEFVVTHNSEIAVTIMAYLMYRVLCLKDPLNYYHMKTTEKISFPFMNITKKLAEDIGVSKFQKTIQLSPWFMKKGKLIQKDNESYWIPPDPVEIVIGSQSSHVIGQPIFAAFFDEISFIRNQNIDRQKEIAMDMIDTAIGGMKTRFIYKGKNPTLLILASSKRSEKSFLEEHMKKKLKSEQENVMIIDEAVWTVKPKGTYDEKTFKVALGNKFLQSSVIDEGDDPSEWRDKGYKIINVPVDFRADFLDDIDRALTDFAGISSSEISKYISGVAVKDVINPSLKNPFVKEILEIGNAPDDTLQYSDFFDLSRVPSEMKSRPLFVHLDMSISGDMTGIAGTWIKGKKISTSENQSKDLFFSLAFAVSIKAPKGRQVSFEKNRNFIYWLKEQGFNIKGITSDTFQSYDTGQTLKAKGYPYDVLSVDRVDTDKINKPYQYLKSTIYEKRIEMFDSKVLTDELIDLERNINTGKVDHPNGGCFTSDTKVKLTDGRSLNFLKLIEEQKEGKVNFVYSFNEQTNRIEPKRILKAWKTLENQPLLKLTLDNGNTIRCTLNHKFMLRDGTYIEAQNLLPHDSLMPLYTELKGRKGSRNKEVRVVSIEYLDEHEDVYDITVEDNHNFALDAGVIVHNSKDVSDAVCGSVYKASQMAEQFAFEWGESLDVIADTNKILSDEAIRRQITVEFEEELKRAFNPLGPSTAAPQKDLQGNPSAVYAKDGIIIW